MRYKKTIFSAIVILLLFLLFPLVQTQRMVASLNFQGFTHYPHDFFETLSNPPLFETMPAIPIIPYFEPIHKVVGVWDWSINNPHDLKGHEALPDLIIPNPNTKVYLMADALLKNDWIVAWNDLEGNPLDGGVSIEKTDVLEGEVDGDVVYENVEMKYRVSKDIDVEYTVMRVRKEIVDELKASGGKVVFPAGTHIGYGMRDVLVYDSSSRDGYFPTRVNPFDYYTPAKQRELLEIYEELYKLYKQAGSLPYTDLTDSRSSWGEPGVMEGLWIHDDIKEPFLIKVLSRVAPWLGIKDVISPAFHRFEFEWELISLVGKDKTNSETFWRVIDHPWHDEYNFIGLFHEMSDGDPPDVPLYPGEALAGSRFYLIDGDLSAGVAMIIQSPEVMMTPPGQYPDEGWNPRKADSLTNHPSIGERRYLRFEIQPDRNPRRERLKIQGFLTEEEAKSGFTEDALMYRRPAGI